MGHQSRTRGEASEKVVKAIRRAACRHYSAEKKRRIVREGLYGWLLANGPE